MLLTRREMPVLIVNLIYVPTFLILALRQLNFEFVLYVGVILAVAGLILWKQRTVRFDLRILWGLTIWGLLHMAGGNLKVDGDVLYNLTLIPLLPAPYHVLRYDQVVHVFGFGAATLVCHHLLRPFLRKPIARQASLMFLIVLMGTGFGALNEIVEFLVVVSVPDTNVGGYENTVIDLICNTIGAVAAVAMIRWSERASTSVSIGGEPADQSVTSIVSVSDGGVAGSSS